MVSIFNFKYTKEYLIQCYKDTSILGEEKGKAVLSKNMG